MSSVLIDWEQLDMIADGFAPDFVEIYHEFLAETPQLFRQLQQHIIGNHPAAAAKVAHQVKGSSSNFGFVGVSLPAAKLEMEAKDGSLEHAPGLLAEAELGFHKAAQEVKSMRGV